MFFVSPQITKVMFDENFKNKLNSTELASWKSLQSLVRGFPRRGEAEILPRNNTKSATKLSETRMPHQLLP
jgi:hypothetical protein